jgi:hypothetical protein
VGLTHRTGRVRGLCALVEKMVRKETEREQERERERERERLGVCYVLSACT